MLPAMKLGLMINCAASLRQHADPTIKEASGVFALPLPEVDELKYMESLGELAAKHASAIEEMLVKHATEWYRGFSTRLEAAGADIAEQVKEAQAYYPTYFTPADVGRGAVRAGTAYARQTMQPRDQRIVGDTSDLMRKVVGDGLPGTLIDVGSYMIPGIGTARSAVDAGSDFINMFGSGLNWKQRLGYGLSSLMNAGFVAADVFTLGTAGRAAQTALKGGAKLLGRTGAALGKSGLKSVQTAGRLANAGSRGLASGAKGIASGRMALQNSLRTARAGGGIKGKGADFLLKGTDLISDTERSVSKAKTLTQRGWNGPGAGNWLKRTGYGMGQTATSVASGGLQNMPFMLGSSMAQGMTQPQPVKAGHNPNVMQQNQPQMPYYGSQNSAQNFRGSSLGSGVQALSRYSAGSRF